MEGGGSSGAGPASSPGASPWCHKPLRPLPLPCRWDPGGCDLRPTGEEGLHLRPDAAARGPDGEPGPSAWSPPPGPLPLRTCVCTLASCGRSPVRALVSGNPPPSQPRSASPSWMHTAPCTRHTPPAHGTRPLHTAHHCFSLFLGFVSLGDTPSLPLPRRLWPILWAPAAAATPPPQAALTWPSPCRSRCLSIVPDLEQGTSLCLSFLF